jgi:hypothetical protein
MQINRPQRCGDEWLGGIGAIVGAAPSREGMNSYRRNWASHLRSEVAAATAKRNASEVSAVHMGSRASSFATPTGRRSPVAIFEDDPGRGSVAHFLTRDEARQHA